MTFTSHLHVLNDSPSAGLVVVEVHQLAAMVVAATRHTHLALPDVDEVLGEFVAVVDVVSTSSPDPFLFEIFGSPGLRTSAGSQLAVTASTRNAVDDARRGHCISESGFLRGNGENGTEDGRVFHRGAIPFMMAELKLAFGDAVAGPAPDVHHVVRVEHAQLLLPAGEPGDLVAKAGGTISVFRAQHEEVGMLKSAHAMHPQIHPIAELDGRSHVDQEGRRTDESTKQFGSTCHVGD